MHIDELRSTKLITFFNKVVYLLRKMIRWWSKHVSLCSIMLWFYVKNIFSPFVTSQLFQIIYIANIRLLKMVERNLGTMRSWNIVYLTAYIFTEIQRVVHERENFVSCLEYSFNYFIRVFAEGRAQVTSN